MPPSKPFWQSKTFWFNFALLMFTFLVDVPKELRALGVREDLALRVATIGNMGLRFISVAQITLSARR